jgi:hypothetical protein
MVSRQREYAESLATEVAPASAVPWQLPRHLYPALVLLAVVAGMFLLRYGLSGSLDLREPLVQGVTDFFLPTQTRLAANDKQRGKKPLDPTLAVPVDQSGDRKPELDQAPDSVLSTIDVPDTTQGETKDTVKADQNRLKAAGDRAEQDDQGGEEGERASGDPSQPAPGDSPANPEHAQKQDGQKGANAGENSSMLDKMRDAMANLLSKLKIPNPPGQNRQSASNQKGSQKGAQTQESGSGQKGEKGQGQPQGKGSPSDDPDAEGQQGEQQAQAGEGRNNDKSAQSGNPNEAKSGMGKQDGDKELRDAEQVAAMGKISEIFGKRAQNITGEVMVEVSSGKQQQLRTGYTQRQADHREAGGEIHRDEVPQDYQHYIRQYFEQVRKAENGPSKPPAN